MSGISVWKSQLARRLIVTFSLLVAVPLMITAIILGQVGQQQIVSTARTMEQINSTAVQDATKEFQELGGQAVRESSTRTAAISMAVVQSMDNKTVSAGQMQEHLIHMQLAIRSQALRAQRESNEQMILAANTTSSRLAARVQPLTKQAVEDASRRVSLIILVMVVLSCGIGCLLALVLANNIVEPVILLAQGAHAIADGDMDRRVDEGAPDELGELAAAFNTMAGSLQKARQKSLAKLDETQAQLVQSAKLASLGTLSAGVAHELNQPVAIIRGFVQQIMEKDELPAGDRQTLTLIETQTSRMMKIIKHLRTFSRMGGYESVPVDVNQVVHDCFILLDAQMKSQNVSVALDLCAEAPPVLADANEIEQVFVNLITNSRDALEGVADAHLSIRSFVDAEQFVVEFRDNGPGIPAEIVPRIFDPFFTTKEAGKGTGLGLSISHSIIEKHRGTIYVKNDPGAVFTIRLPLVIPTANSDRHTLLAAA